MGTETLQNNKGVELRNQSDKDSARHEGKV